MEAKQQEQRLALLRKPVQRLDTPPVQPAVSDKIKFSDSLFDDDDEEEVSVPAFEVEEIKETTHNKKKRKAASFFEEEADEEEETKQMYKAMKKAMRKNR